MNLAKKLLIKSTEACITMVLGLGFLISFFSCWHDEDVTSPGENKNIEKLRSME